MQNAEQKTALIAMSGGVDSSIAAYLMRQADFRCMGTTMRLYRNEDYLFHHISRKPKNI